MRKALQHLPANLLLCLLPAAMLYLEQSTVNASELEASTTISRHSEIPRTLKDAGIPSTEIIGQSPEAPVAPTPSTPSTPEIPPSPYPPIPVRGGASFNSGPGVGYESSFFGLDGFFPITQTPGKNLTYAQGRLLLDTNGGNPGGNFALGYRDFDPTSGRILGGYAGFDLRDMGNKTFSQLGAGVEAVFPGFEFRVNGYLPMGDRRREVASQTFTSTSSTSSTSTSLSGGNSTTTPTNFRFQGNNLLFDLPSASTLTTTTTTRNQINRFTRALDEVSLGGFDAEAGVKIAQLDPGSDLRSYLGLYYYSGEGVSGFVGVRGRLALRWNDTVTAGLAVQGDREFGTTAVATVSLQFPNISRKTTGQPADNWARMGDSAIRNQAVAVTERTRTSTSTEITETVQTSTQTVGSGRGGTVIAQNPTTGQPWVFQHVLLGGTAGTGTFENPFATVDAAITAAPGGSGNDIVYVQAGTNPGIPAFTIKDGVQVLSSGVVQTLTTVQRGDVQLPLSGSGTLPRVAGTVTMGNNTTLGGFNVTGFAGNGIVGTGLRNVTIRDNAVSSLTGTGNGIELSGNLTGSVTIQRNTLSALSGQGITVSPNQPTAQPLQVTISNNSITNIASFGILAYPDGNTTATYTIANNSVVSSGGAGIGIALFGTSQIRAVIDANRVEQVQFAGPFQLGITAETFNGSSQLFASVTNNQVNNPGPFTATRVEFRGVSASSNLLCLQWRNNTAANTGFFAAQLSGTFQREPLVGNTGTVQADFGTITDVPAGTCGF